MMIFVFQSVSGAVCECTECLSVNNQLDIKKKKVD